MNADLQAALNKVDKVYHLFEHRGSKMTKLQVINVLSFAIKKGYKSTSELKDEEVDKILGLNICYKTNTVCKYDCKGLCREA